MQVAEYVDEVMSVNVNWCMKVGDAGGLRSLPAEEATAARRDDFSGKVASSQL